MRDTTQDIPARKAAVKTIPDRRRQACVLMVRGQKNILALQALLVRFSESCGQAGTMQDLPYFLQKPGLLKRVPYLCLVSKRAVRSPGEMVPADLLGALFLLEYRILKLRTQAFATNDRSGRGALLALPQDRLNVAAAACEALLAGGANVVMLSFAGDEWSNPQSPRFRRLSSGRGKVMWSMRSRLQPAYLTLCPTLDETLATLGQKTRSNMRYYRRRAETLLGATFVPEVRANIDDLVRFNRDCMYPASKSTVRWRMSVHSSLSDPFLMGLTDAHGQWLSIVAGRRFGETSEVLWQMNHAAYPAHSLGTVMRSFCMEHELQVEGGTSHSMHHSFVQEEVLDVVVVRSRSQAVLRTLAARYVPRDNSLAEMLKSDTLEWHTA